MHVLSIFLLAAATANAFRIAKDMGNGIFIKRPGSAEPYLLQPLNSTDDITLEAFGHKEADSISAAGIPVSLVNCNKNDILDNDDFNHAAINLLNTCYHSSIPGGSSIVIRSDATAVYACSWGGDNPCNSQEFFEAMARLDHDCGKDRKGEVQMHDWKKIYGRGHAWHDIC